ncbi:MAG: ISLre2 family transposase [Acidaminococcaceae bacterium]|nr:ISLre2 family transposase [Acidaminococcaceae bacterium]
MQSIIDRIVENLKQEITDFFSGVPSIEDVEAFSWTKLKKAAAELTEAYAREIDTALYEDRAGRKEAGLSVERRGNRRTILTDIGEISYERTYYAMRDGTYDYPVDRVLGIDRYQRVSDRTMLKLAGEAKENSYASAGRIVAEGKISRQTVMNAVRRCRAGEKEVTARRQVPVLHVDADEDHVSLQNGKTLIVPLVTVYEGVEKIGGGKKPRRKCINAFHHSAVKAGEEFWDDVYEKIISRYDLEKTKIYLHGDGALWIKQGLEYLPNCTFVLDCYHKNKAKKMLFAGCGSGEAVPEKQAVANALRYGKADALIEAGRSLIKKHPERQDRIEDGLGYLYQNLDAIAIRYQDPEARNGGATEPHVSHVLSRRLSSRPMGWSIKTLEHLVPMLAAKSFELIPRTRRDEQPDCLSKAAEKATSSLTKPSPFAVDPDRCIPFEVIKGGRITQLYRTMKGLSW